MTSNVLSIMGMGAGELMVIIFFVGIPIMIKIEFITSLNKLISKSQSDQFSSNNSGTWILLIPIIGFFYAIHLSKKVDLLISEKLGTEYNVYRKIINNLLWVISIRILGELIHEANIVETKWVTMLNFSTLIFIILRIINGVKLYRQINALNSLEG